MGKPRREERKVCCVCGRRKSKTWTQHKGCNACSGHCLTFLEENADHRVCAFHKQVSA